MSDLVGNPEDRFSHNEAHIVMSLISPTREINETVKPQHINTKNLSDNFLYQENVKLEGTGGRDGQCIKPKPMRLLMH